jgi:3',5'-cyclic AMP phosphodiesterase CpdA
MAAQGGQVHILTLYPFAVAWKLLRKMSVSMTAFPQLRILHISDLHFGTNHFCRPSDATASATGIPTLAELIRRDLGSDTWKEVPWAHQSRNATRLLIAVTGDLTHTGDSKNEFKLADEFLKPFDSRAGARNKD